MLIARRSLLESIVPVALLVLAIATTVTTGATPQYLSTTLKVSIPFAFTVGRTEMPAGQYLTVRETSATIRLRNRENSKSVSTLVFGGESRRSIPPAQLVFHRYGDKYFLVKIWDGSSEVAVQLPRSKAERDAVRQHDGQIASQTAEPQIVTVIVDPTP